MLGPILTFIYFILATPFLVWSYFQFNFYKLKEKEAGQNQVEIRDLAIGLQELQKSLEDVQNELNSVKVKVGFTSGQRKES